MRRRSLLILGAATCGATSSATVLDAGAAAIGAAVCRGSRPGPLLLAAAQPSLSYEGTHILAHGAMRELAAQYSAATGRSFAVRGGGCDEAIAALRAAVADFGGLCCPVESTPLRGLPHLVVAHDWKAVVVHPGNPLSGISLRDLMRVASGEVARWRELGAGDGMVALVVRRHCPDYVEPVRSALLANAPRWSPRGLFVTTDEKIAETTSRFEGALGIVSWVYARPLVERGLLKALSVDGVPLAREAGLRYPLTGPLTLAFRRWDDARMGPFMDFVYGDAGRAIVERQLIPVTAGAAGYRRRTLALA